MGLSAWKEWPLHGNPVNSGVILASRDCVSLDIIAAEMIGFEPLKIPTTAGALKKGSETSALSWLEHR
jgi:uncharacterized protein (DUF362 family)